MNSKQVDKLLRSRLRKQKILLTILSKSTVGSIVLRLENNENELSLINAKLDALASYLGLSFEVNGSIDAEPISQLLLQGN